MLSSRTKRPLRRLVLGLVVLLPLFWPTAAHAESEEQSFARAQELSNTGHSKAALALVTKILKKNPAHAPSRLLLGHLLYASGQVGRAAKQFRHVGAELVPPELAYEYAISLYTIKDCPHAAPAFARVPDNAKEINLAHFYGGICAMQARDSARALGLLKEATNLPPSLEPARRQALHTLEQGNNETAAAPSPAAGVPTDVPSSTDTPLPPPEEIGKSGVVKIEEHKADEKVAAGFHFQFAEPAFLATYKAETDTNITTNTAASNTLGFDILFKGAGTYGLPVSRAAGRPYASLTLDLRQRWSKTTGTDFTYVDKNGVYYPVQNVAPIGSQRFLAGQLTPEVALPLFVGFEVFVGATAGEVLPDMNTANLTSVDSVYLGARYGDKKYSAWVKYTYREIAIATPPAAGPVGFYDYFFYLIDPYDLAASPNTFSGSISMAEAALVRSWESFSLNSYFNYTTFSPATGYQPTGEDAHLFVDLGATKKGPFGSALTLTGRYAMLSNYKQFVTAPTGAVGAGSQVEAAGTGTFERLRGEFTLAPFDWGYLYLRYDYTMYSYSGIDPTLLAAFDAEAPQTVASYGGQIGLKKRF